MIQSTFPEELPNLSMIRDSENVLLNRNIEVLLSLISSVTKINNNKYSCDVPHIY